MEPSCCRNIYRTQVLATQITRTLFKMLTNTRVKTGYVFYQFLGNKQINILKGPVIITSGFLQLERYIGQKFEIYGYLQGKFRWLWSYLF